MPTDEGGAAWPPGPSHPRRPGCRRGRSPPPGCAHWPSRPSAGAEAAPPGSTGEVYPGRDLAHGVLGQGGDGQAGIDAGVGRDDRAVHHVQPRVVVHLEIEPYHALILVAPEGASTQRM